MGGKAMRMCSTSINNGIFGFVLQINCSNGINIYTRTTRKKKYQQISYVKKFEFYRIYLRKEFKSMAKISIERKKIWSIIFHCRSD